MTLEKLDMSRAAAGAAKARIKHLAASATLLSQIAPETSAHLMLECGSIAASNDIALKTPGLHKACSACGTILTSGWTSRSSVTNTIRNIKRRHKRRSERTGFDDEGTKYLVTQCLVCKKSVSSPLEHRPAHFPSRKQISMSQTAISEARSSPSRVMYQVSGSKQEPQIRLPANLASKNRAKARKQSGLYAMLQNSKNQTTGVVPPAFDLMDFMKMA